MEIQCDCGKFRADIKNFPKETPGRLGCYCDDCQAYASYLKRTDVLDAAGCTEVVPVYPGNVEIKSGTEFLVCTRLTPKGSYRWSTSCCNSPIGNTRKGTPWLGLFAPVFNQKNPKFLEQTFGPIRARIMGKFAKAAPAKGTPDKFDFKGFLTVGPFMLKGKILKKHFPSPFFTKVG